MKVSSGIPAGSWVTWSHHLPRAMGSKSLVASRRLLRKGIVFLLMGLAVAFLFVGSRIRVLQMGYEVSRLKSQISDVSREADQLRAEVARKKSMERLTGIALKMGLLAPETSQILFVDLPSSSP